MDVRKHSPGALPAGDTQPYQRPLPVGRGVGRGIPPSRAPVGRVASRGLVVVGSGVLPKMTSGIVMGHSLLLAVEGGVAGCLTSTACPALQATLEPLLMSDSQLFAPGGLFLGTESFRSCIIMVTIDSWSLLQERQTWPKT